MNRTVLFAFAVLAGLSAPQWAPAENSIARSSRGGASHGGTAVVCRGQGGPILEAELLDLYEAKFVHGLRPPEEITSNLSLRARTAERLASTPAYRSVIEGSLTDLEPRYRFLDASVALALTDDVFPVITRKGCAIEQLAVFRDDGEILVDSEIFAHLSPIGRFGLKLHEAIYLFERDRLGAKNSVRSRELVARVLSDGGSWEPLAALIAHYALPGPTLGRYSAQPSGSSRIACTLELALGELESAATTLNLRLRGPDCSTIAPGAINFFGTSGSIEMRWVRVPTERWQWRSTWNPRETYEFLDLIAVDARRLRLNDLVFTLDSRQ